MIALGLTDNALPPTELVSRGMTWTRIVTTSDANVPNLADKIREAKAAGLKVVLTVGGIGTTDRKPSFRLARGLIDRLPRADYYTIDNEVDLDGVEPCKYRRDWMKARRVLGRRLLWGDFSPHTPLSFTNAARACGGLVDPLDVAIHPYQLTDPLAPPVDPKWMEGGIGALRKGAAWLKAAVGVRVRWKVTEFGYPTWLEGKPTGLTAEDVAWLWPRARKRANDLGLEFLIAYSALGPTWRSEQ